MDPRTLRRAGWLAFTMMWIPFGLLMVAMMKLPSGSYAWAELPEAVRASILGVAGFGAMAMLLLFGSLVVGWRQSRYVLAHGLPATAIIRSVSDTGATVNENPVVRLTLEVQPPSGRSFEASVEKLVSRLQVHQLAPGAQVAVKYDPGTQRVALVSNEA